MMEESSSSQGRTLVKISRIVETEVDAVNKRIQTRIKGLKQFDTSNMNHFLDILLKVEEEFSLAKMRIQTRMKGMDKDGSHDSAAKQLKLQFVNKISPIVFPGDEIKGEEGASLEVALFDVSTGEPVKVGPEASATVEIVLLKVEPDTSEGDDWTTKEFEEKIVWDMDGKVSSLIVGNTRVKLQGGIGKIESIKLKHRAKNMNPAVFHLGARVVDTVDRGQIKEAKTQPFSVENYRKKYFLKHKSPAVTDEVSRLVNICRGGIIEKRLKDNGISTVGDFLIRLLTDPEGLKSIVGLPQKKWDDTVCNARACRVKGTYCYTDFPQMTSVTFNLLGEVLGLYSNKQCTPRNMFSGNQETQAEAQVQARELLASACQNWGAVKAFDVDISLQEYLSSLGEHRHGLSDLLSYSLLLRGSSQPDNPLHEFPLPDRADPFPSRDHANTNTSEMRGESSRPSNFSVQSMSSALNSGAGTDLDDLTDVSIDDVEMAETEYIDFFSNWEQGHREWPIHPSIQMYPSIEIDWEWL